MSDHPHWRVLENKDPLISRRHGKTNAQYSTVQWRVNYKLHCTEERTQRRLILHTHTACKLHHPSLSASLADGFMVAGQLLPEVGRRRLPLAPCPAAPQAQERLHAGAHRQALRLHFTGTVYRHLHDRSRPAIKSWLQLQTIYKHCNKLASPVCCNRVAA